MTQRREGRPAPATGARPGSLRAEAAALSPPPLFSLPIPPFSPTIPEEGGGNAAIM